MSRIQQCFKELKAKGRKALVPYITAGDPQPGVTVDLMHALVAAGADLIELGVPFSDPMADGPVIQKASERALLHHISLKDVLHMVRQFRSQDSTTPVVLMGYLNPVEVMGYENFAEAAAEVGVDGVLTVDMPPEEAGEFVHAVRGRDIDPIFLLSPTTDAERVQTICAQASGFVYYVSVKGITGASNLDSNEVEQRLAMIRSHTALPVGVGFGIKDGPSAASVAPVADAVIVGSALVRIIESLADKPEAIAEQAGAFINEIRQAVDAVS